MVPKQMYTLYTYKNRKNICTYKEIKGKLTVWHAMCVKFPIFKNMLDGVYNCGIHPASSICRKFTFGLFVKCQSLDCCYTNSGIGNKKATDGIVFTIKVRR